MELHSDISSNAEAPVEAYCLAQQLEILALGHEIGAELIQVRGGPLRVQQRELALAQTLDQSDQRNLRGIAHDMEHAFTKERAADVDPIKAAGQSAIEPGFDAMRKTFEVQLAIGLDDLFGNPGMAMSRGAGA